MIEILHEFKAADRVAQFSKRDLAFMTDASQFSAFMAYENSPASFQRACLDKKSNYQPETRALMAEVLSQQFDALKIDHPKSQEHITSLKSESTFAIITAHQPCLMSGPLYFIYKIASAIALAKHMSILHPTLHFVPMYVIGSEDHDFDEINHLNLFGHRIEWKNNTTGAVGRMKLDGIEAVLDELGELLGQAPYKSSIMEILRQSYASKRTLAEATAHFVYSIFGSYGIIVADMDDVQFKQAARPLFEQELFGQFAHDKIIENQEKLKAMGFDPQIFPRPINLFHLDNTSRTRIELIDGSYNVGSKVFGNIELKSYLNENTDHFSPNVVLRPLYQQLILPGVTYIGGGAEVAYWMEIKGVFDNIGLTFPMLLRRDSAMWIKPSTLSLMEKTQMTTDKLFQQLHEAQTEVLKTLLDEDWSLDTSRSAMKEMYSNIAKEVEQVDSGLMGMVKGFESQQENFINKLESKMKKSLKSQHEVSMNRLEKIWDDLFPNNSLQERKSNFLSIYSRIGPDFIATLIERFDPLEPGMHVFLEKE